MIIRFTFSDIRNMVVTSVRWLYFAVSISVMTIQSANSGKMTYGLVYRPAGLYSTGSAAGSSASTTTEKSKLEANESSISTQTEQPPDINESSFTLHQITRSNVSLDDDTDQGSKYTENDILPWLMQSAANPPYKPKTKPANADKESHQYQVTEDADNEETVVKRHAHGKNHNEKEDKEENKKKKAGAKSKHHKEQGKKGKESKELGKKKKTKKSGKKAGYEEKKKEEHGFHKAKKDHKTDEFKVEKKAKKNSSKKGFNDKYRYSKEDKIDKYWHSHHEKGVFRTFGRKKSKKHEEDETKKKKKKKKTKKSSKKTKKQGKKEKKGGHKEDSGHQSEKKSNKAYHHESEYGTNKKSKSAKKKKIKRYAQLPCFKTLFHC